MKTLTKILCLILTITLCLTFVGCGKNKTDNADQHEIKDVGIKKAVITVDGYGEIELELDGNTAPITVTNFVKLVNEGFYNGLTFHRIIKDFMIQGGDPKADGTGGSEEKIKGEFSLNGVENNISHTRGVISMARRGDSMDSASSQFFIVHKDSTYLDGQYAAFGKVTKGMEVVDKIAEEVAPMDVQSGLVEKSKQPVITMIKIVE